jgi:hypothetical protein
MRLHFSFLQLAFSFGIPALASPSNGRNLNTPRIETSSGVYVGVSDPRTKIDSFKGIRYVSPPTRFMPAKPLSDVPKTDQSAATFGNDCPQPDIPKIGGYFPGPPLRGAKQSEDCLFLNVRFDLVYPAISLTLKPRSGARQALPQKPSCLSLFTSTYDFSNLNGAC